MGISDDEILTGLRDGTADSDIWKHLPTLYRITIATNAKYVLEIGVRFGNSTLAFLKALEQTDGHLISLDIALPRKALQRVNKRGLRERWTFRWRDSAEYTWEHDEPPDIVFIDSGHLYEGTKTELERHATLLQPGGALILHDTHNGTFPGVRRAFDEWIADGREQWTIEEYQKQHGLTVAWHP